ncbi:MAG TPA: SpoIIE family protein phosphatase [Candidatus Treponema faecavium]|nr:SpoIIE family protein phosphatase [Candidatus Treponema faecavium]
MLSGLNPYAAGILTGCGLLGLALLLFLILHRHTQMEKEFVLFICAAIIAAALTLSLLHPLLGVCSSAVYFIAGLVRLMALKKHPAVPAASLQTAAPQEQPDTELFSQRRYKQLLTAGNTIVQYPAEIFSHKTTVEAMYEQIVRICIDETKADGAALLLIDDFEDLITVRACAGSFPPPYKLPDTVPHEKLRVSVHFKHAQFALTDTVFGQTAMTGKALLITNPLSDTRIYQNGDEDFLRCGSYILCPLALSGAVLGVVAFSRDYASPAFTPDDFETAQILTSFAATSIKNITQFFETTEYTSLMKEAELATSLQQSLQPKKLPALAKVSVGRFFVPATGVCGDYHDVMPCRRDRTSFVVADITGKGIPALTLMIMIRAIIRLIVNTPQDAGKILEWLNRGICGENTIDHYASVTLINYNMTNHTVDLATSGNAPILLYRKSQNSIDTVSIANAPIGIARTTQYHSLQTKLKKGDILITFTDGLIEALNSGGYPYTSERLKTIIEQHHDKTGQEIADLIQADVRLFCGTKSLHDDQTLLIIKNIND